MEIVEKIRDLENVQFDRAREDAWAPSSSGQLLKILGVGFGIAVGVGGTIGVGILRNPSGVAAQLGSFWMIMLV